MMTQIPNMKSDFSSPIEIKIILLLGRIKIISVAIVRSLIRIIATDFDNGCIVAANDVCVLKTG
jgi:hypothetical protein